MLVNQTKHSRLRQVHAHGSIPMDPTYRVRRRQQSDQNMVNPFNAEKINKNLSSVSYFVGFLYLLLITIVISGQLFT